MEVSVRRLCDFGARAGDLDHRTKPSPSALEGQAGHQIVTAGRPAPYESEVSLRAQYQGLTVQGRADGYNPDSTRVEEIKTHRIDLATMPEGQRTLHWVQAKIYGHMFCQDRGLEDIEVALVYWHVDTGQETVLTERFSAITLREVFDSLCEHYLAWAQRERAHRRRRDASLDALSFPHASFRKGQREIAEAVFNAHRSECALLLQAPTGIGKSLATLFPVLKACKTTAVDKVFYLTAKTNGRRNALNAIAQMNGEGNDLTLRVTELASRESACANPDRQCHPEDCSRAQSYFDKLPAARQDCVSHQILDLQTLRSVADIHDCCPHYLAVEMVKWSDVVIADYHHYFDGSGYLWGQSISSQWRISVMVDEAHNLLERARRMHSVSLSQSDWRALLPRAPAAVRATVSSVLNHWPDTASNTEHQALDVVPTPVRQSLDDFCAAMSQYLAAGHDGALMRVAETLLLRYFDALQFCRLARSFDTHSVCTVDKASAGQSTLSIRNIIPGPFIGPRLDKAVSAVLFSATISPHRFYQDVLGLPENTVSIDTTSPFSGDQLTVNVVRDVPTRYSERQASLPALVNIVLTQYRRRPGNYLVFASSYEYLESIARALHKADSTLPLQLQSRHTDARSREAYVASFREDSGQIGLAVLGGALAEGIDLPGKRLIGAFIATIGLAPRTAWTETVRQRLHQKFDRGEEYAYLYPALQKVIQAAGRVIRHPNDRGVLFLIDDRYARADIQTLLPRWWSFRTSDPRV